VSTLRRSVSKMKLGATVIRTVVLVIIGCFFINVIFFYHIEHSTFPCCMNDVHGFLDRTERVIMFQQMLCKIGFLSTLAVILDMFFESYLERVTRLANVSPLTCLAYQSIYSTAFIYVGDAVMWCCR
jgi:hypothetical protein